MNEWIMYDEIQIIRLIQQDRSAKIDCNKILCLAVVYWSEFCSQRYCAGRFARWVWVIDWMNERTTECNNKSKYLSTVWTIAHVTSRIQCECVNYVDRTTKLAIIGNYSRSKPNNKREIELNTMGKFVVSLM